jgi:hypothetical protein
MFGAPKYTINTSQIVSLCSFVVSTLIKGGISENQVAGFFSDERVLTKFA